MGRGAQGTSGAAWPVVQGVHLSDRLFLSSFPDASAALQVRAMKDYCNNYDLTSLNVKAGDIITVSLLWVLSPGSKMAFDTVQFCYQQMPGSHLKASAGGKPTKRGPAYLVFLYPAPRGPFPSLAALCRAPWRRDCFL